MSGGGLGRGWVAWVVCAFVAMVCAGIALSAYRLADYSWNQVVEYKTPYAGRVSTKDSAPARRPLARRVVLVIVDGLRYDASQRMDSLKVLRTHGADLRLIVPEPSLSYPNWTTILSGAPQQISGVTTNWFEGRVPVQTIIDRALAAGRGVVVVGPSSLEEHFRVGKAQAVMLRDWKRGEYLSGRLVTDAVDLARKTDPSLVVLHLPDIDEAGHDAGGASSEYQRMVDAVDIDLARLVNELQGPDAAFVIVSDHGHIDTGGHGGWEPEVVQVPAIIAGAGARAGTSGAGRLEDVASTVTRLMGLAPPAHSLGSPLAVALAEAPTGTPETRQLEAAGKAYARAVYAGTRLEEYVSTDEGLERLGEGGDGPTGALAPYRAATDWRRAEERGRRLPLALGVAAAGIAALFAVWSASRRAFAAAMIGALSYYAAYYALFFGVHRYRWSLSSFNSEMQLSAFFNGRMLEAAASGLAAAFVAALVYVASRERPRGPQEGYGGGWGMLGAVTILAILATLAIQVAWFLWAYGAEVTWALPDFRWGFKYDLDLVQATALGAAALPASLVTYLVGRYHPKVVRARQGE